MEYNKDTPTGYGVGAVRGTRRETQIRRADHGQAYYRHRRRLRAEGSEVRDAGRCRFLGALVRPMPRRSTDPGGTGRRVRWPADRREAEYRRISALAEQVRCHGDPDDDRLQERRGGQAHPGRGAEADLEAS